MHCCREKAVSSLLAGADYELREKHLRGVSQSSFFNMFRALGGAPGSRIGADPVTDRAEMGSGEIPVVP